jgi:RIO-like serine/threonine protein kinase
MIGKINRRRHFCFVPLGWLGRLVTHNEVCNLRRCAGIAGVPKIVERADSHTYFYEYIDGTPLSEKPELPADFFEKLRVVLRQIHARRLVHFDLHKRGNILLGRDGQAYIIDFQVSTCISDRLLLSKTLSAALRRRLQAYDIYHLYKHKRRLLPEELTEAERAISTRVGLLLRVHRFIARPYKAIRRACLHRLHAKGILHKPDSAEPCAETDPTRWTK